ncbi:hypothetical protein Leryth_008405 [Lithospermum erythrorhizon]|nr:hypothetical protein Leryth_008405 [Lithospermum erythrorhizon]
MNCLFWIFYGLPIVHPDSTLVITINAIGLFLELSYLLIFFIYTHKKYRIHIVAGLLAEVILLAIVAAPTLKLCHTHAMRSMVVGIVCIVFGVIMYSSPLSIMKKVITTKSVEFMPFWLSVAAFSNGVCWTVYALLQFDLYILISNGLGAVSGAVQLILYACYYKRKPSGEEGSHAAKVTALAGPSKLPAQFKRTLKRP